MSTMFEKRPWGSYEIIHECQDSKIKIISVKKKSMLSYQSHKYRCEDWVFLRGSGFVILEGDKKSVTAGDHIRIPAGSKHRVVTEDDELVFAEVQTGSYFGEDDIERFEDSYGRV